MSSSQLPGLTYAFAWLLVGAPLLVLALRRAARVLPARRAAAHRWPGVEATLLFLVPVLVFLLFGAWVTPPADPEALTGADVLTGLVGTQLGLGTAAVVALFLARRRGAGLESLGLRAPVPPGAFRSVLWVYGPLFVCLGGLGIAWTHVCRRFGWEEEQEVLRMILTLERQELIAAGVLAILVGPWIEELLFRGFLQPFLGQYMNERAALVLSAFLFARLHGMAGLPLLFGLALFLGWLQQRTRCLWVPWSAHALNNAVTLGIAVTFSPQ